MSDEYFLIKGTPEEWIKNNVTVKAYNAEGVLLSSFFLVNKEGDTAVVEVSVRSDKSFLTDPTLTKPTIRVPVWGQEFKVQGVKMEKGVICVDVTPPIVKDQYGNVLAATAWVNDVITVKTPPKTGSIMSDASLTELKNMELEKENERLKKEHSDMFKKMEQFRENYRKEHERANKLQDSEAAAKRELRELHESSKLIDIKNIQEQKQNQVQEISNLRLEINRLNCALNASQTALGTAQEELRVEKYKRTKMEERIKLVQDWLKGKLEVES